MTTKTITCGSCGKPDEEHEMTKCTKCGCMMCPECLYVPTMNSPCFCAPCRSNSCRVAKWSQTITPVKSGDGDYLDRFAEQYPEPGMWALSVCSRAGTSDAAACIPVEAGKMLADFENWSRRAQKAMKERKALSFDSLCSELDDLIQVIFDR